MLVQTVLQSPLLPLCKATFFNFLANVEVDISFLGTFLKIIDDNQNIR